MTGLAGYLLVPLVIRLEQDNDDRCGSLVTNEVMWWITGLALPFVLIGIVWPMYVAELIAPSFSKTQLRELSSVVRICVPSVFLVILSSVMSGLLQARGAYYSPVYGRALFAVCVALAVLVGADRYGIQAGAVGIGAGAAIQICLQITALVQEGWKPGWPCWKSQYLREIVGTGSPILLALILTNLLLGAVQRGIASSLPEGSLAVVNYANRILSLVSIITMSHATVALTELSRMFQRNGLGRETFARMESTLASGLFVIIPFTIFLGCLSEPVVAAFFHRGRYGMESLLRTSDCLRWFLVSVVPGFLLAIFFRAFQAFSMPWKVTVISFVWFLSTVVSTLISLDKLEASAIPASYSGGTIIACLVGIVAIRSIVGSGFLVNLGKIILRVIGLAAGPMLLTAFVTTFVNWQGESGWTLQSSLSCVVAGFLVFCGTFTIVCMISREPQMEILLDVQRSMFDASEKCLGTCRAPHGRASLSPASRTGRVPHSSSGSPGRTRPTRLMAQGRMEVPSFLRTGRQ